MEIPQDQEDENLVVDADAVEEVDHRQARSILTRLLATGAGCVAIWPVTIPKPDMHSHREVAMLALPVEDFLNLHKKVQEDADVKVALYDSVD